MALTPGDALGHYRILSRLGAGGMGEVYLAEDTKLRRQVAVKVLPAEILGDADRRGRFLREARSAAAVDHPNIIHIYDVVEEAGGLIYLVMQHVEGTTLRQAVAKGGLGLDRSLGVAFEVADALTAAHAKGIIHRDIKPDNIMIDAAGHARLLDFGLARVSEPEGGGGAATEAETIAPYRTTAGAVMGTAAYMSPEQAIGEAVDHRSDLFSFGITLYEMVTGRHPFAGRTPAETTDALLHSDPKPVAALAPGAPAELEWVVSKMLAKDREDRYQSAREVLTDLKKLRHSTPGSAGIARPAPALRKKRGRSTSLTTLIVWAVVVIGTTVVPVWLALRPERRAKPDRPFPPPLPSIPGAPAAAGGAQRAESLPMRLAVLPFENVRRDARIDFLGFAIADAIISKLSYLQSVSVRPSSYVQKYRDRQPDPKEAGRELGVDHILTGSLMTEGDWLRVSVQFVDLRGDAIRWQDTVDSNLDNLLELQDQIVERVVTGMRLNLTRDEETRIDRDVPRDPAAYAMVLKALALPTTLEGDLRAIEMLRESVERDPGFAPAWGHLAERQYEKALYGTGAGTYEEAERSIRMALEINPDHPQSLQRLAVILTERGRHEEAYRIIHRWITVNPSSAEAHFALQYLFRYTGLLEQGAAEGEKALRLAPGNPGFRSIGLLHEYRGDLDRAEDLFRLDEGSAWSLVNLADLALLRGDDAGARVFCERALAKDPDSAMGRMMEALIVAIGGDRGGAARILAEMASTGSPDPEMLFSLGVYLAWVGEHESAAGTIQRAVRSGFYCLPAILNDPRLADLRGRAEFAPVLEEARRKHEAFKAFVAANP